MSIITIVGSLNYDLVTFTDKIPIGGETYQAEKFETHIGGKGLNQAIATAKTTKEINDKFQVRMVGSVGDDSFGLELIEALKKYNVDITNVKINKEQKSGVATILVEKSSGENRILITEGANGSTDHLTKDGENDLETIFPINSQNENYVIFQNEIPGVPKIINWIFENRPDHTIIYNPSPYYEYSNEILSKIDVLIVNEGEALSIMKDNFTQDQYQTLSESVKINNDRKSVLESFGKIARSLQKSINPTKLNLVILTLGPLGSIYSTNGTLGFIDAKKVENVIDTTGAGDTFLGALVSQISNKKSIESSLDFATIASSLAISRPGASDSIPTYLEIINEN
ncbi:hypothetical protein WICMUC_003508 [Wickerhamomyces mucosus]|uniref:Ribokinase n=1 Tax=Wickerhamomyces mucosus TaxID=1378264 RepID=A0A9P8PLN8_9ASCO|nr:hypothetical protein WICMUC_003508 [Wickerhamomyces mucosus]